MTEKYSDPKYVLSQHVVRVISNAVHISDVDKITGMFFLLSKSEQDNERWEDTFRCAADGNSVFFFAKRLDYDGEDRGCTVGIAGWTTANGGNDKHGDFIKLAARFKRMGGLDLRQESKGLTEKSNKVKKFERLIQGLHGEYAERFVRAQFKELCSPKGYIYEAHKALCDAGIENPSPLAIAAVMDTVINQGIGGKYCPIDWIRDHPTEDEKVLLDGFLDWKRVAATKNHHNSPPSNGRERADMFKKLLRAGQQDLSRAACEEAVQWKMK